jgi:hypothetical protein
MFFGNKTTHFKRDMLPANSAYIFILNMAAARSSECRYISTNIHGVIAQKPVNMCFATCIAVLKMKIIQATGLVRSDDKAACGKAWPHLRSINVQEY